MFVGLTFSFPVKETCYVCTQVHNLKSLNSESLTSLKFIILQLLNKLAHACKTNRNICFTVYWHWNAMKLHKVWESIYLNIYCFNELWVYGCAYWNEVIILNSTYVFLAKETVKLHFLKSTLVCTGWERTAGCCRAGAAVRKRIPVLFPLCCCGVGKAERWISHQCECLIGVLCKVDYLNFTPCSLCRVGCATEVL